MIDAHRSLILKVGLIADVQVIVGILAAVHRHHVRHRNVLHQESFQQWIDTAAGDHVSGKLRPGVRKIAGTGRFRRIVSSILDRGCRIINLDVAVTEIALNLFGRRYRQNLSICS